jgi:hypothetical protein
MTVFRTLVSAVGGKVRGLEWDPGAVSARFGSG